MPGLHLAGQIDHGRVCDVAAGIVFPCHRVVPGGGRRGHEPMVVRVKVHLVQTPAGPVEQAEFRCVPLGIPCRRTHLSLPEGRAIGGKRAFLPGPPGQHAQNDVVGPEIAVARSIRLIGYVVRF